MPVVHMVWFKTPTLTPENWEELRTACKNLETIPGVISAEIGTNRSLFLHSHDMCFYHPFEMNDLIYRFFSMLLVHFASR
jgi:hypothetical protein